MQKTQPERNQTHLRSKHVGDFKHVKEPSEEDWRADVGMEWAGAKEENAEDKVGQGWPIITYIQANTEIEKETHQKVFFFGLFGLVFLL